MLNLFAQVGLSLSIIFACTLVQASSPIMPQEIEAFDDYVKRVEVYLDQNKPWIDEANKINERQAVMPFERAPSATCNAPIKGVLLSHGLSDSPYGLQGVADALSDNCIHVRVILLPGHGTQSSALMQVTREDWQTAFDISARQLAKQVDEMYVGGFSTGGALALSYAMRYTDDVKGVVLFSPLLKINSGIDWLSPVLRPVISWLDNEPTDDYAKYASIPVHAIAEAYWLAKEVRDSLTDETLQDIPVFIALSEEDNTVDSDVTIKAFNDSMTNSMSQMILYSSARQNVERDRIKVQNTYLPEMKISSLSHTAVHGDPNHPYYGQNGVYRLCVWYEVASERWSQCKSDQQNWYGEKGSLLEEQGPHGARLTWNPFFEELMLDVVEFLNAKS